ncbi:ribosomal RNA large subunit methyltransferase (cell division protein FtsJ) [Legionella quinlivanii]|uniref:Ribosomal RNA large subunit methyltransferase E n=1 Tax=Legionella quinlivanii TaxID=45073 RepID=A0A0W0Y6Z5_9GAMM|nr:MULTISPECIES: 23S rRNA (uridine(2552)-2'-O)-methyltransferase RlmE [Legionella]KTD52307.1 ribosomal RNA large subunit methyltransferase (cell division protein FtsJ) [Legionella quinlivanii]MCE3045258.1 23S rRNA (uridine(2552)-2'-O)-methyltransferase RlmE [Legionella sp. 16cNR16C]MCW8449657.1 23S rRNA (uridine(2552)-2'-O)-methyltransferase RlmE [Legionella quinlivanii]RAP36596.1 23S rRNA (uridine(2552)-2'-O)-methyltransferase [Legionella quinlivanii]SEF72991.1 23S rRNA Um-2552 2'-O-methyltra
MPRSKSSKRWLQEHFDDFYVKKAQAEGYRSRAVYKLKEVDEREHLLRSGMTVVDLGAAPGGWTQYISQKLNGKGNIIALDILPMDHLADVTFIQGDFREDEVLQQLLALIPERSVDLLLSDMAPNMSGSYAIDIPKAMYLAELAFDFADKMLKPKGAMLMKVFHGEGFDELVKQIRQKFGKVAIRKPAASRSRSRETYLLAKDYNL